MPPAPKTYVLAVPSSDETRSLSREAVLAELARGQITSDYWVWSPDHSDWKQISEFPELQPPTVKALPLEPSSAAFTAVTRQPIEQSVISAPSPAQKKRKIFRRSKRVNEEQEGFPYLKFIFGALYVAVAAIILGNYLIVDKTLEESLAHTPFVLVPAHAHLGSFVQPDALIIHVLPSRELTPDNFADFLQTLAKSTPSPPFQENAYFHMVALSPAWFSEYALNGSDWKSLGGMSNAKPADRQDFITDHLCNIAGQPLIPHSATMSLADLKAARANAWQDLTARFRNR